MELWIRTQNREALVKTNIIKWENGCLRGFTDEDGWYQSLGIYKKKRALEVLDEIQNRIIKLSALEITGLNEKNASIYVKIFNEEKINNIKAVYEMPSE